MRILERRRRLSKPERRPVLQCALPAIAWAAAVALYAVSLPDLAATPRRFPASPLAAIVAGLASAIEQFGLPTMWLVVFAGALLLSALLLPPDDRRTLRWLRQGWLGAAIGFIGGLPELPRGLLLMDVVLFGLSIRGPPERVDGPRARPGDASRQRSSRRVDSRRSRSRYGHLTSLETLPRASVAEPVCISF